MNRLTRNVLGFVIGLAVGVLFFSSLASADVTHTMPLGKYDLALVFVNDSGRVVGAQILGIAEDFDSCMEAADNLFDDVQAKLAEPEFLQAMRHMVDGVEGATDFTFACKLSEDQTGI